MLKNYKFPKDFSDRVTLLLSEPGDFAQPYVNFADIYTNLNSLNQYRDAQGNLSLLDPVTGKKRKLSKEQWRAINSVGGINTEGTTSKSDWDNILNTAKTNKDSFVDAITKENTLRGKKAQSEIDAIDRANFKRLPQTEQWAHKIASRTGKKFNSGDDAGKFIGENAGEYLRLKGQDWGKTAGAVKENAPKIFDSLTGFKGSKDTQDLRSQRAESVGHAAQNVVQSRVDQIRKSNPNMSKDDMDKYRAKMEKFYSKGGSKAVSEEEQRLGEEFDKDNAKKIQKAKDKDSTLRARKIMGGIQNVGTAIDSGLDMVSSKHRAQTLATQGHAGIARKQARMAQLFGDKSLTTKFVAGNWGSGFKNWGEGMGVKGLIGNIFSKGVDRLNPVSNKIRSNEAAYQKSARYFSEQEEHLSWQPEEYAKLKFLLEKEYENPEDFSEQEQQPYDGQGFYDASKEVDISSLTPEAAEKLLNKSYYAVADDEKKYQESIAKGFSEEHNRQRTYENFLNECAEVYDLSAWR